MPEVANKLYELFKKTYRVDPGVFVCAPGRVNLLGEHVDYNEGPVLPVAIDRQVRLVAAASRDHLLRLYAIDLGKRITINLDHLNDDVQLPNWARYPAGVAWAFLEAGYKVPGMQVVYTSDVPIGAGLSSSAAVEVAFAAAWQALAGWRIERLELAQLCQRAENGFVGVSCGLMDQFASACGVAGHALYFDTRSLAWQAVPLPADTSLVIADSGGRRSLATSEYNERRASCEQALAILRQYLPDVHSLRDITPSQFQLYANHLPEVPRKRAEHVVYEIERVEIARQALVNHDALTFGTVMYAGHTSLRDLYEVSTPGLNALVEIAGQLTGCIGARLTGAGFGGCTINLVKTNQVEVFIRDLNDAYFSQTGKQARVFACQASQGVSAQSTVDNPADST